MTSTYLYDQTWHQERDRIGSLEELFDASTKHHLDDLGLCPGWTCLEVGCGAVSIANWLADRVGPSRRVVATDTIHVLWTATDGTTSRYFGMTS